MQYMMIKQDELTIRDATALDAPILGGWWRDGKVMAHAGFPNGLSISDQDIVALIDRPPDICARLIIEREGVPIGEMSYRDKGDRIAEIGIKICDATQQEKGYGTRLYKMLMNALFTDLNYTTIITDTNLKNVRAQHVYENKIGFRRVSVDVDAWRDQLGVLQSTANYEMKKSEYKP